MDLLDFTFDIKPTPENIALKKRVFGIVRSGIFRRYFHHSTDKIPNFI